jgi:hypothetical protein
MDYLWHWRAPGYSFGILREESLKGFECDDEYTQRTEMTGNTPALMSVI